MANHDGLGLPDRPFTDPGNSGAGFGASVAFEGRVYFMYSFRSPAVAWGGHCAEGKCNMCLEGDERCTGRVGIPQLCVNGEWVAWREEVWKLTMLLRTAVISITVVAFLILTLQCMYLGIRARTASTGSSGKTQPKERRSWFGFSGNSVRNESAPADELGSAQTAFCTGCGAPQRAQTAFCSGCGARRTSPVQ